MSEELKPCPFCGGTPTGDAHTLTQGFKYGAIECGCGAIGPDVRTGYEDWPAWKEAAAKEWNERAELAALKAGQGEAVAPYGYLREVDGNVQLSVGPARPADRSGGCATPWAAIFAAPPASAATPGWRCYHCDENFNDADSAGLHFGTHQRQSPACLIDVAEYRAMEARMHAYNDEDTEIHRAMARMNGQHRTALQREEEKGYARALKDTGYDATGVNVPSELLEAAIERIELNTRFPFGEPQTPGDAENRKVTDELRALLAQSQEG